ncbi:MULTISPECIES: CAP domain-containing protein [unclassified Streptomyces]|uniref:CAP domain-containing protein n=1 Tax=unclassified Streptomyces TaxID=2593676 RepID=UPI00386D6AEA
MRKHRRKTPCRRTTVALVAVVAAGAVGIPTAAMASDAPQEKPAASTRASKAPGAATRVLKLVNRERRKAGCSPLKLNAELTKAAQVHSADMASHRNMSHTGSGGSAPDDRISRAGYDSHAYGENIAHGYATPESVVRGWMASPGHKRNILDCSFKEIGVGLARPGNYWTQDFGTAR